MFYLDRGNGFKIRLFQSQIQESEEQKATNGVDDIRGRVQSDKVPLSAFQVT